MTLSPLLSLNHKALPGVLLLMNKIFSNILLWLLSLLLITGVTDAVNEKRQAAEQQEAAARFEAAVSIIKRHETMHKPKHWPFVGYGHKVLPGEKFDRTKTLSEEKADELLRKDLRKNIAQFRDFGKDSILMGTLAYNIGMGAVKRSAMYKRLKSGDRNIKESYISHCRYKGKVHNKIKQRRQEEFDALYVADTRK